MRFTVLVENTPGEGGLQGEHGLSLHIQTGKHRILFDMGESGLFARNAEKLGVDLSEVDIAVVSHGHYDHGGGLPDFFALNARAPVYIRRDAFGGHFARRPDGRVEDIGLQKSLLDSGRFVLTGDSFAIDEDLTLFAGVDGQDCVPTGNSSLLKQEGDAYVPDDFRHEQNLLLREGGKLALVSGCSHRGIINIIKRSSDLTGETPTHIIGGFHLSNPAAGTGEDPEILRRVGEALRATGALCRTGHCTGTASAAALKTTLGDRLEPLKTGGRFDV